CTTCSKTAQERRPSARPCGNETVGMGRHYGAGRRPLISVGRGWSYRPPSLYILPANKRWQGGTHENRRDRSARPDQALRHARPQKGRNPQKRPQSAKAGAEPTGGAGARASGPPDGSTRSSRARSSLPAATPTPSPPRFAPRPLRMSANCSRPFWDLSIATPGIRSRRSPFIIAEPSDIEWIAPLLCPLPLRERAARCCQTDEWVRGC